MMNLRLFLRKSQAKICIKQDSYKIYKKSSEFSLNLDKHKTVNGQIKKIVFDNKI